MKLSVRPSIPPYAAANARWNSSAFPVNKTPLAPSAVLLVGVDGFIKPPRELTADEINGLIQQFVQTAKIAEQAGFSGVQIHAAHGYLISQFLSPHHNRRQDPWGGSLENRMRFLLETYTAIRAAVGKDFLVGVKLNSADFQKGGFDESESVQVVQKLSEMGIDFIEVSGGNYESPQMLAAKDSTRKREAFFIDYAEKARAVSQAPLIITGGFRSQTAMEDALSSGHLDLVGVARPFALVPDLANKMQNGTYQTVQADRIQTGVRLSIKKSGRDAGNELVYDANGLDWARQTAKSQIIGVESIAENFVGKRQSGIEYG